MGGRLGECLDLRSEMYRRSWSGYSDGVWIESEDRRRFWPRVSKFGVRKVWKFENKV